MSGLDLTGRILEIENQIETPQTVEIPTGTDPIGHKHSELYESDGDGPALTIDINGNGSLDGNFNVTSGNGLQIDAQYINYINAMYQSLPGLVGFWPMSSVQRSTGNAYDLSGQARTLTYNGNPTYNIYNDIVPYIDFDGTGDYLSRPDETDLDIQGNETIYNVSVQGLTMGGWFNPDNVGVGLFGLISKYLGGGGISYLLYRSANLLNFTISNNGIVLVGTTVSGTTLTVGNWYCVVCRFTPSTENAIFVNGTKDTNVVGIPATINNSTTAFEIGRYNLNNTTCFDGKNALSFLCANALPDNLINSLFQQTRVLFGV